MTDFKKCSYDGCDKKHRSAGYCSMHYLRLKRHGSLEKPISGRNLIRREEKESAIAELNELYDAGKTRQEIIKHFEGRRGLTWITENYPKAKRRTISTSEERAIRKEELLNMHEDGYSIVEAIKMFKGRQCEDWVRRHWPEWRDPFQGILKDNVYGHMDVKTVSRAVLIRD